MTASLTSMTLVEAVLLGQAGARTAWAGALNGDEDGVTELRSRMAKDVFAWVEWDDRKGSLLHHAAARGDEWAVAALMDLGASPHRPDPRGQLPVEWAAEAQQWNAFQLLWIHGVPARPPIAAPTLVHSAARAGPRYVEHLAGGGLNWPVSIWDGWDEHGRRPLHCAADANDAETARHLLRLGSRPSECDGQGRTPQERHAARYPHHTDAFYAALAGTAPPTPPPANNFAAVARKRWGMA